MGHSASVNTELTNGVLRVTLNRPEKLNALNDEMHLALQAAFQHAHDTADVRAVLLTGTGKGFCAGQDLGDRDASKGRPDLGATISRFYNPLMRLIRNLAKPVVCAVNGVAAGAGANIALGCDIVLAAESARFIQAFAKIGLLPDSGGTFTLPRLLGEARAKALALTADPLDAKTAAQWGLIWKAVSDDTLMFEAVTLAERLAAGPTLGLGQTKMAIQAAATNSFEQQLDLECELQRRLGESDDYAEGVSAFLNKRQASFKGR